ncbi:MAG: transposase, partial [Lachnospiraceae bacterium]|nr:transposase [Lachnospiraceae bacterium]
RENEIIGIEKGKAEGKVEGKAEGIIETGLEFGLSEEDILMRLQKKLNISLQKAQDYMDKFARQTV